MVEEQDDQIGEEPAADAEPAQAAEPVGNPLTGVSAVPPTGGTATVVNEPPGDAGDEYRWHTGINRPTGVPDAVEFLDVHKAFGRNKILRGLNMGLPEGKISMILGPSGTGKSVCIKHMVGLLYPDEGDVLVHGESVPRMRDEELFDMRKKFGVLFQDGALFGSMNLFDNVAFPLRQHTDKGEEEITDIVEQASERGRARGRERQDAQRALGRDAQARRLRARAGARPRHRALRRARLGPGSGPHGAAVRADPGDPRGERRRLRRHHARHHDRPSRRRVHRGAVAGADRRVRARRRSSSTPTTRSSASSSPVRPRARWAWSDRCSAPATLGRRRIATRPVRRGHRACSSRRPCWSRSSLLGGNGKHEYKLVFETAGQLVNDNNVQIGGRAVGTVTKIELTDDNQR